MMYGRTAKQIKIIALISFILSIIATVVIFMLPANASELGEYLWLIPIGPLLLTFGFMSFALNTKNIFRGIIRPIPILSMMIEYLKGYWYGIRGLIWALKQPKDGVEA